MSNNSWSTGKETLTQDKYFINIYLKMKVLSLRVQNILVSEKVMFRLKAD